MLKDNPKEFASQVYGEFKTIKSLSQTVFNINNNILNSNISFIIFQAHSYVYDMVLSYNKTLSSDSSINGTNIGLYSPRDDNIQFYLTNPNPIDLKIYISINAYTYKGMFFYLFI